MFDHIFKKVRQIYGPEGQVPLHAPIFKGNERRYLQECIDSTFVSTVGRYPELVEEHLRNLTGSIGAVVVVNGTSALQLALQLTGVVAGDEVICQSLTFVATANAITYCGARPIFIDADPATLSICPRQLEKFLAEKTYVEAGIRRNKITGRAIKSCILMHTFGHLGNLREITSLCEAYGLALVEDAAEALGSTYENKYAGTFGNVGVLSFNGNKVATAGGGGAILCQSEKIAAYAKHLTTTAKVPHPWEFVHDEVGYNFRMPNINAALLLAQLECLEAVLRVKREIAASYREFFKANGIDVVEAPAGCLSNYWLNAIRLKDRAERDRFLEEANKAGIQARPLWRPMHLLEMYAGDQRTEMKTTEDLYARIVCLPSGVPHD